ncbi:D-alanyl-D-alanine carboxypeptidase [compost metagenome]
MLEPTRAHFGGKPYRITSGLRSTAEQRALWEAEIKRLGSERAAREAGKVAPPGTSEHEKGTAADGRIAGVTPLELATFQRTLPAVGGSGVYDTFAHVDTRPRRGGRIAIW